MAHLTISQHQTVPTTGQGYQPAAQAQGWIVLYNALEIPQAIPAGTLLMSHDGTQITTDTTVSIPAGHLSSNGRVWVHAHAMVIGPAGNIAAGDLAGPCCQMDVLATNPAPFTGGTLASAYQAVSAQDLQQPTTQLTAALSQQVQAAFQTQLEEGESLLTPITCTTQSTSDHAQGSEATQVTVTVTDVCQGMAYQTAQVQALALQAVQRQIKGRYANQGQIENGSLHVQVTPNRVQKETLLIQAQALLVVEEKT